MRGGGIPLELPTGRGVPARQMQPSRAARQVEVAEALNFPLMALGHNLRASRKHAGYTQIEIARKMKAKLATVRGAETGKVRVPPTYVPQLMKVCGLPRGWKAGG